MLRWLAIRFLSLVPVLLGISFVAFLMLDLAPVDRAELEATRAEAEGSFADAEARQAAIQRLRVHYGMLDPQSLEPRPLWRRYSAWLSNVLSLQLAGPGENDERLWRRLIDALPVTALLGSLSLLLAFGVGMPLGGWLGRHRRSGGERTLSAALLALAGLPEFLLAALLLLMFSGAWLHWLPATGLRSPGSDRWTTLWQLLDFAAHLVLPVTVMALGPLALVARFVRDAVARAVRQPFSASMRALGLDERLVRRRLLRHGAVPVATLTGSMLPMLVAGSIVVENMFALDGLGHLTVEAVVWQDQALVMASVLLTSIVTLVALMLSDVLHRVVDPRVRLGR